MDPMKHINANIVLSEIKNVSTTYFYAPSFRMLVIYATHLFHYSGCQREGRVLSVEDSRENWITTGILDETWRVHAVGTQNGGCAAQHGGPALVRARNQLIIQSHVANWSEVWGTLTQPQRSTLLVFTFRP